MSSPPPGRAPSLTPPPSGCDLLGSPSCGERVASGSKWLRGSAEGQGTGRWECNHQRQRKLAPCWWGSGGEVQGSSSEQAPTTGQDQTQSSITATTPGDYRSPHLRWAGGSQPVPSLPLWGTCRTPAALHWINYSGICRELKRYLLQRLARLKLGAAVGGHCPAHGGAQNIPCGERKKQSQSRRI